MLKRNLILNTVIFVSLTACASNQRKQPQFEWGQSLSTVKENEAVRLETEPKGQATYYKDRIKTLTYEDKLLNARCALTYWFENDHLIVVSYSCSNPDWDEEELKGHVRNKLTSLHGEPATIPQGDKWYDYYVAQNAHIYFRIVRIPSDRLAFRTFQANIFYSQHSHEKSKFLKALLPTFGR
ncbi:hypothetical protein [Turneriella parva]|uniref:hypothetical protein n=1 Tax=Turneriella parva TaxID=29510 RepID=UPI0005A52FC6|nr:hypothetical protein [Turneriella parva]